MNVAQGGGGGPLTGYQRRAAGIDPALDPRIVELLVRAGLHVSGVNDNPGGGHADRALRMAQPAHPALRGAAPAPDLSGLMQGGEGDHTFNQGLDPFGGAGGPLPPIQDPHDGGQGLRERLLRAFQGNAPTATSRDALQQFVAAQAGQRGASPARPILPPRKPILRQAQAARTPY